MQKAEWSSIRRLTVVSGNSHSGGGATLKNMPLLKKPTRDEEIAALKKALKEKREALSRALGWAEQDREAGNIFLYMIRTADARYFSKQLQKIIKRLEELGIDTKKLLKEKY